MKKISDYWVVNEDLGISREDGDNYITSLSNDFYCVYYIDFDKDLLLPYRVAKAILADYEELLANERSYIKILNTYCDTTVIEEDREMFRREIKPENLIDNLRDKLTYFFDFRAIIKGQVMACRLKAVDVSPSEDKHICVMGFSDVSKEMTKQIENYAFIDELTQGDNYNRFKLRVQDSERDGYIISIDIRSFKVINAACGVSKGDEVIRRIWRCIVGGLDNDICAAHINADRFVAFMPEATEEQVIYKINALTEAIKNISAKADVPILQPYYGVAKWEVGGKVEEALTRAHEAKHQIRDRKEMLYSFYTQEDFERLLDENKMEEDFEEAIRTRQFEVWYQPKYSTDGDFIEGAEALVRWRKSDGTMMPPGKFIPLFERNGMIPRLDEYVFRTVCTDQKRWQDEGCDLIPISVNLSRASLYFVDVADTYVRIAHEIGIDPKWIPIEITETFAIDNDYMTRITNVFTDAGFPLHMDDFGTGYSSLSMLNKYNFDTLKLDKSLVDYIGNYSGDRLLMHTISLAKDLGMQVVAEGVEDNSQVGFLERTQCDFIQGYIYSKPLPKPEFDEVLKNTHHAEQQERVLADIDVISSRYKSNLQDVLNGVIDNCKRMAKTKDVTVRPSVFIPEKWVYMNVECFTDMFTDAMGYLLDNTPSGGAVDISIVQRCDVAHGGAILDISLACMKDTFKDAEMRKNSSESQVIKKFTEHLKRLGARGSIENTNKGFVLKAELLQKLVLTI